MGEGPGLGEQPVDVVLDIDLRKFEALALGLAQPAGDPRNDTPRRESWCWLWRCCSPRQRAARALVRGSEGHRHPGAAVSIPLCDAEGRRSAQSPHRRGALGMVLGCGHGRGEARLHLLHPRAHRELRALRAQRVRPGQGPAAVQEHPSQHLREARCVRQIRVQAAAGSRCARKTGLARQHAPRSALRRTQRVLRGHLGPHQRPAARIPI